MGQYHAFACLDTGEAVHAHLMGEGLKLMEQGFGGYGGPTTAFALLVSPGGRWHGMRVAVVGDYAQPGDLPAGAPFADSPQLLFDATRKDDFAATRAARALCGEAFGIAYTDDGRRDFDAHRMASATRDVSDDAFNGPLYVVDLDSGQYLDPHEFGCGRNMRAIALRQGGVMLAATVLLAVSNGRGGGDFRADGADAVLVGSWGGHRVVVGPKPGKGDDLSARMKALIVAAEGEEAARWGGAWDQPGSLPAWLARAAGEEPGG